MELYDIHTHQIPSEKIDNLNRSYILDVEPLGFEAAKENYRENMFSCGIHPWYSNDSESRFPHLSKIASDPKIVAIGETGLDKIKGPSLDIQIPVFKDHIAISEEFKKPLIIHVVKAWQELYHIRKELNPSQPWIIHGFRGNPHITQQMAKAGFMFSIGKRFNPDSLKYIPNESLFLETDEEEIDIKEVYEQVACAMDWDIKDLAAWVEKNVRRVFPRL